MEQLVLADLAPAPGTAAPVASRLAHAASGAAACLARLGARLDAADRAELVLILGGVFPALAREALDAALGALGPTPVPKAGKR
jgi:hypothetical protein